MHGERFDDLSRIFALGTRRRDLLRGMATGVVASAAAYLLGRPIPEARARAGDPCDQIAVEECIRKAVEFRHQLTVGCIDYFCSDGLLGRLDCECYSGKYRKLLGDEIFKCWNSTPGPTLPACGGELLCKPDIALQGSSFCCKAGWFAEGGVCTPCVRTCDPAKEKLYLETCQCMCDVDKVSRTCGPFEGVDPTECRCKCIDDCPKGQEEGGQCRCKCDVDRDCPNFPCAECINGLCEPCPEGQFCCYDGAVPRGCCDETSHCCPKDSLSICRLKGLPCVES
jgi:hypothetical protein